MMSSIALALSLSLALGAAAEAPKKTEPAAKKKVAVLPFDVAKGMDASLGKTFSGALLGEIRKLRGNEVNIMAPDDVVQALPETLRSRLKRCQMAACKAQMAQAAGADRALGGDIGKVGNTVVLNLAVLESSDGAQVTQWTGKAPEQSIDKLLDQLPAAVAALFPVAAPPVVVAPPPPVAAATPPPPVVAATPPPPQPQPQVAPLLPTDEFLPPPPSMGTTPPASTSTTVTAQTDTVAPPPSAAPPEDEPAGWNKGFVGGGLGLGIPVAIAGGLFLVAAVAGVALSITSHVVAYNINQEVRSVTHKEDPRDSGIPVYPFDLSALIFTGRAAESVAFGGYGLAALSVLVGLGALVIGIGSAISLVVAGRPKEDSAKKIKKGGTP